MRIPFFGLKMHKFFDADPDPGSFKPGYGMEKFGSGINIRNTAYKIDKENENVKRVPVHNLFKARYDTKYFSL
jgi:hypothetical protein